MAEHRGLAITALALGIVGLFTAGGLVVAVFTLPFYNFYMSRVSSFVREMETSANILVETFDEMEAVKA